MHSHIKSATTYIKDKDTMFRIDRKECFVVSRVVLNILSLPDSKN